MAILHLNGWDHFDNPADKGWIPQGTGSCSIGDSFGRYGTRGYRSTGGGGQTAYTAWLVPLPNLTDVPPSSWKVGFGAKFAGATGQFFQLTDGSVSQVAVSVDSGGRLHALGAQSTRSLFLNRFYYIEVGATIATSGSVTVRVNGETWISVSGDTQQGGQPWSDRFYLGAITAMSGTWVYDFDDVYVMDGNTAGRTSFLGDSRIYTIYPAVEGTYQEFDLVGAADSPTATNEHPAPDGDATYVQSVTLGQREVFWLDQLNGPNATVDAIQVNAYVRKTAAGTRAYEALLRQTSGATEILSHSPQVYASDAYQYDPRVFEKDGNTTAWTLAKINQTQFGIELVL